MLVIEIEKLELTGGHIEIMLFIENKKLELDSETPEFDSKVAILKLCYL